MSGRSGGWISRYRRGNATEAGILIVTQGKGVWIPTSVEVLMNVCCAAAVAFLHRLSFLQDRQGY